MDIGKSLSMLYRTMNVETNTLLAPLGLTTPKVTFLFCIHDHNEMTQAEIGRELNLDRSSVAKMLDRLEKDDLIKKEVNPKDVRAYLVSLTDKGAELVPKAREIQREWFDSWLPNLTDFERKSLYELLEKAAMTLDE